MPNTRVILRKELLRRIPLSYQTIHWMMAQGRFPLPIKLTDGVSPKLAWKEDEIQRWLDTRPKGRGRGFSEAVYAKKRNPPPRSAASSRPVLLPRVKKD
jgi:prophage regulatory protein